MDPTTIARKLGMKASEVLSTEEAPAGLVVRLFDGTVLIDVPADQPDGEGKAGVMFLVAPDGVKPDQPLGFPVYALPVDDLPELDDDECEPDDDGDHDAVPSALEELSKPELVALAEKAGVEHKATWSKARIIAAIEAGPGDDETDDGQEGGEDDDDEG